MGAGVLAEIGEKDGSKVTVKNGRFGAYINWKRVNAKLPVEYMDNPSELPLDEAWSLIEAKAGSESSKSVKRKQGKKEPEVDLPPAPKRPLSSYFHFCAEKRPGVAASAQSLGSTSKELARLWAEITDEDKKPYITLAESGKSEYEKKKKEWLVECQTILEKNGVSRQATRKSNGVKVSRAKGASNTSPKRPKSAYLYFCSAKREEVSKELKTLGEATKELARLWGDLPPNDRKEYDEMAAEDKLRYKNEKLDVTLLKSNGKKHQTAKKGEKTPTKKKRGPSAYMLFCAAHRNSIVDENGNKLPLGETTKRLAQMWKTCDEESRARFMAEAEKQKAIV